MEIPHEKEVRKVFVKYGVQFAYLFGSRANGQNVKSSDFDFAVLLKEKSKIKRFDLRLKLLNHLMKTFSPVPVDILILNDIHSTRLRHEIITTGRLMYEKNAGGRLDFELFTMREYEDFSPFLKAYNEAYLQRA